MGTLFRLPARPKPTHSIIDATNFFDSRRSIQIVAERRISDLHQNSLRIPFVIKEFCSMILVLKNLPSRIPEFCASHWLLRIPLAVVFIQQGLSKFPVTADDAASFELPYLVWWFVAYGELGAGIGLLAAALMSLKAISNLAIISEVSDMLTRFCGITICSIMTGVIWISRPESLVDVILYDNLHVFLWVGGLYFALRGNRT